ncbi:hypothetical protein CBF34_07015 [Vagococcus penaei]|uniref:hypothetical protein n=1 Tax=Vagococcus penaei TaxID=633807 RepID=UPI000F88B067|nr:hypothetical protein [Vagococcus penaei]RSU01403.1 hypothetical protein CBF34_07015 [Vagococcus penaei]
MWMIFLGLRITEWIAVLSFLGGISYGILKFYHLFNKMLDTLNELKSAIETITTQNVDHEKRITSLEMWKENFKGGKS